MAESSFKTKTMKRKNMKGLVLTAPPPKPPTPSTGDAQMPGGLQDDGRHDTLEIGVEFRLDLKAEDLIVLRELGSGNGGTVSKVQHAATKVVMARKIIHVEAKNEIRKRIVRELRIMHDCNDERIVAFYGAFQNDTGDVIMCMEYMDVGSLDWVSKTFGPVRVDVLGKIAESVLGGLSYLYSAHRIMHRDLKPSNILVNSKGQIKLCDFGVSSELEGSIAETFVGTGTYMAPERIQGSPYTVKSDVWSVGLTLMELAIGKFPFGGGSGDDDDNGPAGILDLLQQIVLEPAPKLPKSDAFPAILEDMVAKCLLKDPQERPTPKELYDHDAFLQAAKRTPVDLEAWAVSMIEHNKRKSYLAPAAPSSAAVREKLQVRERSPPPSREIPTASEHKYRDTPTAAEHKYAPSRDTPTATDHRYSAHNRDTPTAAEHRYSAHNRDTPTAAEHRYSAHNRDTPTAAEHRYSSPNRGTPTAAEHRYSSPNRGNPNAAEHKYSDSNSNGSNIAPPRPPYPARTSSSTMGQNTMSLPIRPAPPPQLDLKGPQNGGLPPAPRRWNNEA